MDNETITFDPKETQQVGLGKWAAILRIDGVEQFAEVFGRTQRTADHRAKLTMEAVNVELAKAA